MPRAIEIILSRNLTDKCKPGDKVMVAGCLAAIPDVPSLMKPGEIPRSVAIDRNRSNRSEHGQHDNAISGLRKLGVRNLGYRLTFIGVDVKIIASGLDAKESEQNAEAIVEEEFAAQNRHAESVETVMISLGLDEEARQLFQSIAESNNTLDKLAISVAPEIFGCEYIKKGILMMLVGGVEKNTGKDNLKLRGDINVCIVGDPGTAKSQLLKFVHQFADGRAVYAAGNTSTAAGLTVSVHRDPDQGDSVIEAGALLLADRGICCIDEFDKMDIKDMVAIHEAMEQQTISVCKAGIHATLNARASVLAACNPRFGRYDQARSFRQNVKLSAPIISRFDIIFILMDSTERDALVARHLINLHMHAEAAQSIFNEQALLSKSLLRKYLAVARSCNPHLSSESRQILVDSYVAMRAENLSSNRSARVTVRQLESLIRLSEAVAKLKLSDVVLPIHVKEARYVMQNSMQTLRRAELTLEDSDNEDTETDAEHKKGSSVAINSEEFERIAETIIERLRTLEVQMAAAAPDEAIVEAIVAKDDLITWYIENVADPAIADSEALTAEMYLKLNRVISRMVNKDFSLIEEVRDMNVPVGEGLDTEIQSLISIRLHPNLATDQTGYHPGEGQHASLPTSFYGPPASPKNTDEVGNHDDSWMIDDQEFMNYMYGWKG